MFLRFVPGGYPKTLNLGKKMYAVGRLGSYISRGVYTFSGPFHAFGGAVDIVVVQQEDGSFKSSPWYVRFGKFQGVLKAKEKIVDVDVNGVEANFHMYLDQRGEAFFLKEVDTEDVDAVLSPPSSSGAELDGKSVDRRTIKCKNPNNDFDQSDSVIDMGNVKRINSRRSRILGFVLGRKSVKEKRFQEGGVDSDVFRTESMERAVIAADLLEVKWSTNLASGRSRKDNALRLSGSDSLIEAANKDLQTANGQEQVDSLLQDHLVKCLDTAASHEGNTELNSEVSWKIDRIGIQNYADNGDLAETAVSKEAISSIGLNGSNGQPDEIGIQINDTRILKSERISSDISNVVAEIYSEAVSIDPLTGVEEMESSSIFTIPDLKTPASEVENEKNCKSEANVIKRDSDCQKVDDSVVIKDTPEIVEEQQFLFSDLDDSKLNDVEQTEGTFPDRIENDTHSLLETYTTKAGNEIVLGSLKIDFDGHREDSKGSTNHVDIPRKCEVTTQEVGRLAKSLPNMWSQFVEYDAGDLHNSSTNSLGAKPRSSKWKLLREDITSTIKLNEDKDHQLSTPQPAIIDSKEPTDKSVTVAVGNPSDINDATSGSRRLWPFGRTRSRKFSESSHNCKTDSEADNMSESSRDVDGEKEVSKLKQKRVKIRVLAPTSEQLASLNLKEGKNLVTFSFSTSMLGEQQVEARIYLWRWDTRIVISDVDGTITKSDVLGQFMPMVGRDWSQTGVAHLFSAIKENGYQFIFLSARAISQSYQTRQFLFNIKQDGKCLPDGPVVISPDGLFPSLFREVIRRAPHEFKIGCLEAIKACFPSDRNPFYAGFGNRDTDEFSYLKVGIPKGKIFIINPKGEVVVNRRVDSKSYTSLHALVNDMFPPISTHEEEDYNSWNFWKLRPPSIDT